ncbi:MAG TPA: hypothetical protein VGE01_01480 [Fimbriimonas sp.]
MTAGAQAIQATLELLSHFPDAPLQIHQRPGMIEVVPTGEGGFSISVYDEGDDAMIAAERWHTHYEEPDQAAWCVFWLLTPFYRVVHEFKGGVLVAVWIERYEATGWEGSDPVYYLNPEDEPSWELSGNETYGRRYIQQAVLPSPEPYDRLSPGVLLDEEGLPPDFAPKRIEQGDASVGRTLFE